LIARLCEAIAFTLEATGEFPEAGGAMITLETLNIFVAVTSARIYVAKHVCGTARVAVTGLKKISLLIY